MSLRTIRALVSLGCGLPVPGLPVEELGGEGCHRVPRRAGAAVVPDRFGEGGNQPAGLAPRLGDGHGVGVAKGGEAPAPARRAVEGEAARAAGEDAQEQAGNHVVADIVALGARLGTRTRRAKVDLVWSLMVAAPVWAARPGVSTGSSRGGVSLWKPLGGAGRDGP